MPTRVALGLLCILALPPPVQPFYGVSAGRPDSVLVIDSLVNNFGKGPILESGQRILQNASLQSKHAAAKLYDGIRNSLDDVGRIAKNTGLPEFQVARIKDHVFRKLHRLEKGLARFDPDLSIAQAWRRLEKGTHLPEDLRFLKHELAESRIEGLFKANYQTAHTAAERAALREAARRAGDPRWRDVGRVAPRPGSGRPAWLDNIARGNNFNKAHSFDYRMREVCLNKPGGGYVRVDGYDPLIGEIVSRKATQMWQVQESTAIEYLRQLASKYPPGARIATVPSSGPMTGQFLWGVQILELPIQSRAIPAAILNEAHRLGILIRDVAGNVY